MIKRQAVDEAKPGTSALRHSGGFYEIRVRGQLSSLWADWLEDLQMTLLDDGEMTLAGYIADQAALMGILNKLYGLNLTLLSVSTVDQKH